MAAHHLLQRFSVNFERPEGVVRGLGPGTPMLFVAVDEAGESGILFFQFTHNLQLHHGVDKCRLDLVRQL